MKNSITRVFLLSILTAFACNTQQNKKTEGDASVVSKTITEKPLRNKIEIAENKDSTLCENLVKEILITSPRYRQLTEGLEKAIVKNGGLSFGISLEGSPNPNQDKASGYSKTYDYTLYEIYADRQLNIAHFSFNPITKKLYEYDAVSDQLKPIAFDRNIVLKREVLCK